MAQSEKTQAAQQAANDETGKKAAKKDEFCSEETIKRGQEAIQAHRQTNKHSDEEEKNDAEKWRNEG